MFIYIFTLYENVKGCNRKSSQEWMIHTTYLLLELQFRRNKKKVNASAYEYSFGGNKLFMSIT